MDREICCDTHVIQLVGGRAGFPAQALALNPGLCCISETIPEPPGLGLSALQPCGMDCWAALTGAAFGNSLRAPWQLGRLPQSKALLDFHLLFTREALELFQRGRFRL